METEKVCVNLSAAELGKLDLLVEKGLYVNRTDAVRAALRQEFATHDWDSIVERDLVTDRRTKTGFVGIGLAMLRRADLEAAVERNEKLNVFCAGIVLIENDVTPDLADRSIGTLRVLGSVRGPKAVVDRLGDRIHRGGSR